MSTLQVPDFFTRPKALLTHRTSCLQAPGELFWLISIGFRDIPLGSSVAQGLTIIRRLLPGDEDYAFHVLDVVLALFTPRFLYSSAPYHFGKGQM
jgi:hypothetical protein